MPTSNSVCVTEAKKRKEPEAIVDEAEEELSSVKKVKLERSLDLAHAKITTSKTHNTAILISSDIELPESDSDSDVQVIEHASSTIATKSSQADDAVSNTSSFSSSSCIVITDPKAQKEAQSPPPSYCPGCLDKTSAEIRHHSSCSFLAWMEEMIAHYQKENQVLRQMLKKNQETIALMKGRSELS